MQKDDSWTGKIVYTPGKSIESPPKIIAGSKKNRSPFSRIFLSFKAFICLNSFYSSAVLTSEVVRVIVRASVNFFSCVATDFFPLPLSVLLLPPFLLE